VSLPLGSVALFLLTTIFYLNFFSRIVFAPLLPVLEQELTLSHSQAGLFFVILSSGYFVSLSLSGFVAVRLGHKKTIILSASLAGLSLLAMGMARSLPLLRVFFFCLGLGAGIYLPSAVATISVLFRPHQLGRAFAIHELAPNLAFLTAPFLVALALVALSWQQFIIFLASALFAAALLYGCLGAEPATDILAPNLTSYRTILSRPSFWFMILLFSMGITGTLGIYNILPVFLVNTHHYPVRDANMLIGVSRSISLLTACLGGWLSDRIGRKQTMRIILLFTGLVTVLLGWDSSDRITWWVWLQPALAVSFFPAAFAHLATIVEGSLRNLVIALTVPLAFVVGGGIVPALIAFLADRGLFSQGIILAGIFIGSGGILLGRSVNNTPARIAAD